MKKDIEQLYKEKLMSASEAVFHVQSGNRLYVGGATSVAYSFLDALWEQRHRLENVTIMSSNCYRRTPIYDELDDNPFLFNTYFVGVNERKKLRDGGPVTYNSVHLSMVTDWMDSIAKPDICFFNVSAPDENGNMSYGSSGVCVNHELKIRAKKVFVQVDRNMPFVLGEKNSIHVSEVIGIVEQDEPYEEMNLVLPDETSEKIAAHILEEIPDGATFQLGLGSVSSAIGYGLRQRNDLGIHSELLNQAMLDLMHSGNVTNAKKGYMDGKTVFCFSFGCKNLFEELNYNEKFFAGPFGLINDPRLIAKNNKMMSINAAMSINLFGEAAADCLNWSQQSAVGGQVDFVRGAQWSPGGKSFIALTSSFEKNGKLISRIVPYFAPGTAVTTSRADIQYVATEYGCVNLKALTAQDRARALISLAHPAFREELSSQAKAVGLL